MFVCICHPLTDNSIRQLIREKKIATFKQLVEHTFAATGCGTCREDLKELFDKIMAEQHDPERSGTIQEASST